MSVRVEDQCIAMGAFFSGENVTLRGLAMAVTGLDEEQAVREYFEEVHAADARQARAGLLLHGLAHDPDFLDSEGVGVRKRALELMDDALTSVYGRHHIVVAEADYLKIPKLAAVVPSVLQDVADSEADIASISGLGAARNSLQRALNANRLVLSVVIPFGLCKPRLGEVFDAVAALGKSAGAEFLADHSRAKELASDYAQEVERSGGMAKRVLGPVAARLGDLIERTYADNPATEPATVRVSAAPKKYPLDRPNEEIRLLLRVENAGPGQALDVLIDDLEFDGVRIETPAVPLGQLVPGNVVASIAARTVGDGTREALILGTVRWTDSDGSSRSVGFEAAFQGQRTDIEWSRLRQRYDLDPVSTTDELLGRGEVLRELADLIGPRRVGSAFLTGQKRVGKTSIALTLRSTLAEVDDVVVVYLDGGAFVRPSGDATISALGVTICEELRQQDPRFADAVMPEFEATLSPLKGFIGQLRVRAPKLRVLVVIDEFDELPVELYRRGPVADALFLSLRSLASLEHIGFVLIGGEKMGPIVDAQGDQLNKFDTLPISYLDRQRHWDDFTDLVRVPVDGVLEISDEAVVRLYELSSGHPYFTKLICRAMFKLAVQRHDAHVTVDEIEDAVERTLQSASTQNFIHFWEDGIVDSGEAVEEVSVRRRKFLLAYAESADLEDTAADNLTTKAGEYGLDPGQVQDLSREFARRGIFEQSSRGPRPRVRLFDMWLLRSGVEGITTTFTDPDAILHAKQRDLADHVEAREIAELVDGWGLYCGMPVGAEDVRAWLGQFETVRAQRLMFKVLEAVDFYNTARIRASLKDAHGMVRRGLHQKIETGKTKRDDIVVSYLGEAGKSGSRYARLYASENDIYTDCVHEPRRLPEVLQNDAIQALVLIDDMTGSGDQAITYLTDLNAKVGGLVKKHAIKVVFVAIAGFDAAERRVVHATRDLDLAVEVKVCNPLTEADKLFSSVSRAFPDSAERSEAKGIAESHGRRLQRRSPLGYKGVEAAVVFDESCPNGSLPILWDATDDWRPLFRRHKGGA